MFINISKDMVPTASDSLQPDCLYVELPEKLNIHPGSTAQVNILVGNTSQVGRYGRLFANYDFSTGIKVNIPNADIYVAPQGKTTTYMLVYVSPVAKGNHKLSINVS